jgi:high-affinity Fe2+/Pb2+ permease
MSSAFIQAAIILLREGLEAILVIAALAGYLTKAGAAHRILALYGGSLVAVGASIIAAWLFAVLNSGEHSDVAEGIIILVAAGLMLYVSGWLLVKQNPRRWQDYLAHKADSRAGIPGAGDIAGHRAERRGLARCPRTKSDARGAVRAAPGDPVCACDLFRGSA